MKTPSASSAPAKPTRPSNGSISKAGSANDGLIPIIGRGALVDGPAGRTPVTYVVATDQVLEFQYDDGRRVAAPLTWYPRLLHGSPAERNSWELKLGGRVVLWRSLGIGIAAKALVAGMKSDESEKSVSAWLAGRKVANGKRKAG